MINETFINSIIVGTVGLLGAIIGGFFPNFIERKTREKIIKQSKLEEIYSEIEDWYNSAYKVMFIEFTLLIDGHINWNQYLDRIINNKYPQGGLKKIYIIIYLYFSELEKDFKTLHNTILDLDKYIHQDMKEFYLHGRDLNLLRSVHLKKTNIANASMEKLKEHMHILAKKIS